MAAINSNDSLRKAHLDLLFPYIDGRAKEYHSYSVHRYWEMELNRLEKLQKTNL